MTIELFDLINKRFDFKQIYLQVEDEKEGKLYKVMDLMVASLKETQLTTKEVCDYFEIKSDSSIKDDLSIAFDCIVKNFLPKSEDKSHTRNSFEPRAFNFEQEVKNFFSGLSKSAFLELFYKLKKQQMEIIIVTAFILLAVFTLGKINKDGNKNAEISSEKRLGLPTEQPIPSVICLVVPASAVSSLTTEKPIDRSEIIRLIDAASYFLCVEKEKADKLSIDVDTDQTPLPDSKLNFYTRIDIDDGRDIVEGEGKTKYVIKRDLPPNVRGTVQELGRLRSISSISSFNRI